MSLSHNVKRALHVVVDFMTYGRNQFDRAIRKLVREQHQLTSTTSSNRYPELFQEVRTHIDKAVENPSILSFGCSTGEECFSLKTYFPKGRLTGVDINNSNLRKARRRNVSPDISFHYSTPENIAKYGKYDAIFALSVLCRWEDTMDLEDCSLIYSFEKFSETVQMLATQVRPGGLLVIYNANFRFEESAASKDFEIIPTPSVENSGFVHKFDAHNHRVRDNHVHCVYRKKQVFSA